MTYEKNVKQLNLKSIILREEFELR
jgi:hypothetical protein